MYYYIGLLLAILLMRGFSYFFVNERQRRRFFFISAALLVIVFQGLRAFSVGTDIKVYISGYTAIGTSNAWTYQNFEIGYVALNKLCYFWGLNARAFLAVAALLIQAPIFYTLYKYAERPLFSVLIYFAFGNFYMTFSGLRQSIAMTFCFLAYIYIKKRRPAGFVILVLFAMAFHTSAVICLLLYPLYHHIRIDVNKLPFAMLALLVLFFCRRQLLTLFSLLYYGTAAEIVNTGAYTMFLFYLGIYLISFFVGEKDKDFEGLRNILLLLVFINCFASVHNHISRAGFPLTLYLSFYIPTLIKRFRPRPSWLFYLPCYAACIAFFLLKLGSLGTLPFQFFFTEVLA